MTAVAGSVVGAVACRDRASDPAPAASAPASARPPAPAAAGSPAPGPLPAGWETPDHDVAWLARAAACATEDPACARTRADVLFHVVRSLADADAELRRRPEHAALVDRYVDLAVRSVAAKEPLEVRSALGFIGAVAPQYPAAAQRLRREAVGAVRAALGEDRPRLIRDRALLAAGVLHDAASRPALLAALDGSDVGLARRAATALALLGDPADDAALARSAERFQGDASSLAPSLPAYVNALARLHREPRALELVDRVLAEIPDAGNAWAMRAALLGTQGRRDEAREAVARAVSLGNAGEAFLRKLDPADVRAARDHAPSTAENRRLVRELLAKRGPRPPLGKWALSRARLGQVRFAAARPAELEARAEALPAGDEAAARALGAELFASYTFRSDDNYDACLRRFLGGDDADLLDALGLQVDRDGVAVGVVRTEAAGEPPRYGLTCAVCHGGVDAGGVARAGVPTRYDQGLFLAACADLPLYLKSGTQNIAQLMRYGPGRNDSSADFVFDPTDIPHLFHLGAYETLRWNGDVIGIENQATHNLSPGDAPWPVLRAVGAYLRDVPLPDAPAPKDPPALVARGRDLFERACATCHLGPALTSGHLVPVDLLGTDPTRVRALLGNSYDGYKVPSLARVSLTAPYLHDGSVATLEQLLDPARLDPRVRSRLAPLGVVRGSLGGHRFGLERPADERRAIVAYLRTL